MNFRVRCINTNDSTFIKGKIYDVSNCGEIVDEKGYGTGVYNDTSSFEAWCKECNWVNYEFELVEDNMKQVFTKLDLKVGYLIEQRNGVKAMVMPYKNGICLVDENGFWLGTNEYNNDMIFVGVKGCDIMKIYGLAAKPSEALMLSTRFRPLLWQREEPINLTKLEATEICAKSKGVSPDRIHIGE